MYAKCFKRIFDFLLSLTALVILCPVLLILAILGAIMMKGNPFFTQRRPGKDEKIFRLIKFRTMTCEKDAGGNLLPDEQRLNRYGKLLRSTSLDELPEAWNILKGDMSVIGPRPWAVRYLPYFTEEEHKRHLVRPGLSGWAQVNGRTASNWDQRLRYDLEYVEKISFGFDLKVLFVTVKKVLARSDVVATAEEQGNFDDYRKKQWADGTVPKPADFPNPEV